MRDEGRRRRRRIAAAGCARRAARAENARVSRGNARARMATRVAHGATRALMVCPRWKQYRLPQCGARIARREERAYRRYVSDEQRCEAGRTARQAVRLQRGQATSVRRDGPVARRRREPVLRTCVPRVGDVTSGATDAMASGLFRDLVVDLVTTNRNADGLRPQRLGAIFQANDCTAIFPSCTTNVSLPTS